MAADKNALRVPTWPWPGPFKAWKGQPQTIKQLPSKEVNVYWLLIYLPILLRSWQNLPMEFLVLPQVQCHFDATWPMSKPIFGSLTATGKKIGLQRNRFNFQDVLKVKRPGLYGLCLTDEWMASSNFSWLLIGIRKQEPASHSCINITQPKHPTCKCWDWKTNSWSFLHLVREKRRSRRTFCPTTTSRWSTSTLFQVLQNVVNEKIFLSFSNGCFFDFCWAEKKICSIVVETFSGWNLGTFRDCFENYSDEKGELRCRQMHLKRHCKRWY